MSLFRLFSTACALALAAAPSFAAPPAPPASTVKEDAAKQMAIKYADALLKQGKAQQAIDEYLNPVIAYYEKAYAGQKRQVYCARSSTETLMYMLMASKDKRSAVAIGPTWSDALYLKAYALVDLGRPNDAKALLERAIALAPMNAVYRSELGNYYQQAKDWPRALATFDGAIEATDYSPNDVKATEKGRALRGTGYALSELGRYDEAENAYHKALALNPNDKMAQAELLYIARKRGKGGPIRS